MKSIHFNKILLFIFLGSLAFLSVPANATSHPSEQQANEIIHELYHKLTQQPKLNMQARLNTFSGQFLGKAYLLGALGEGAEARYDQEPQYRLDAFDCQTYVETILALALANNLADFKQCMHAIRYQRNKVSFIERNHFTSLDWNPHNQQQGFIKDITQTITHKGQSVTEMASALIDKPSWYQHLPQGTIRLINPDKNEQLKRWEELKQRGSVLPVSDANIPYIPLTALFDKDKNPNQELFAQIPNGAIIEIVRPNWNLRDKIGTNLNVSHLGFAFWHKGILVYREASSEYGKIVDIPLIDYLKETLNSPTIKGINIQVVLPQRPLSGCVNPKA